MKIKDAVETCGPLSKEHGYLGHFKQDKFMRQGHNDSEWPADSGPGLIKQARKLDDEVKQYTDAQNMSKVFGSFTRKQREQIKAATTLST